MKKRLISLAVVLVALTVAWTVYAAEGGGERRRAGGGGGRGGFGGPPGMSAEEREGMRERFENMSEEERAKLREQMRARFEGMSEEDRARMGQRFGGRSRLSREDQLKAIKAMQEQLTKLKAAIESETSRDRTSFRDLSQEERTKLMAKFAKSREDRQKAISAIQEGLGKLGGQPMARPQISVQELTQIRELAAKEKAEQTVKRLNTLIERQKSQAPRGFPGGRLGGERGPGGMRRPDGEERGPMGPRPDRPDRPAGTRRPRPDSEGSGESPGRRDRER